jgi:hypothetical protein
MSSTAMRAWDDFVVSSHLAFLPAVVLALVRGLWDAAVLIIVMVFLSIWYHREAEKNQFIANIELCSTCALFIYGASQGFYAPSASMLAAEVICASITVSTYIAGFFICQHKHLYDLWHPIGLHLVPAVWALLVAAFHESLLFAD